MPRLIDIDPVADRRWDELVVGHPQARVSHLGASAEILHRCYGFQPHYLGLEDEHGALVAGLPLMRTRGLYRGTRVVSLPLASGGPLAVDPEHAVVLLRHACELAREAGTTFVMRTQQVGYDALLPELRANDEHPAWIVKLTSDPEEVRARFQARLRRYVRESEKNGLIVRDAVDESDLRRYYRLYAITQRRHGRPPRPYRQMLLPWRMLGATGQAKVVLVEQDGVTLSAGLFHALGKVVEARFMGSDPRHHRKHPNHALYWHMLRWACTHGYETFDFLGAAGSLADFKRRWGAEPVRSLKYVEVSAPPRESVQKRVDRHQFLWRRFPVALASVAGAVVFRYTADPAR